MASNVNEASIELPRQDYGLDKSISHSVRSAVELTCISYNMHGFNQGCHTVRDLFLDCKPDIFFIAGALANAKQSM